MTIRYDLLPSANPQRDHDRARSRAVALRKEIADLETVLRTGCDLGGNARARLMHARMLLDGARDEMRAMVKQGADPGRRMTASECERELARLRGEEPRPRRAGPIYLTPDGKAPRAVRKVPSYITKDIVPGRG
jgi:hypothetical protein